MKFFRAPVWARWASLALTVLPVGVVHADVGRITSANAAGEHAATRTHCEQSDARGQRWGVARRVDATRLKATQGPIKIICRKKGYKTAEVILNDKFANGTRGNVVLGDGFGVILKASSRVPQKEPELIVIWMQPEEWKSEQSRLAWEAAKRAYEQQ